MGILDAIERKELFQKGQGLVSCSLAFLIRERKFLRRLSHLQNVHNSQSMELQ